MDTPPMDACRNNNLIFRKIVTAAIALCWCSQGCIKRAESVYLFDRKFPWAAPKSFKSDRMEPCLSSSDPDYGRFCSALWDIRPERSLVALRLTGGVMFGQTWNVVVADKTGYVSGHGQVRSEYQATAYCLLEFNTDNPALPPAYKNRWALAVGFIRNDRMASFDPRKPIHFSSGLAPLLVDDRFNWIEVEPVEWDADLEEIKVGIGILDRAKCDIRFAERAMADTSIYHLIMW